jgi:hypothetical protein
MSAWIFIIGLLLFWAGVSSRLARRERRSLELAALNYPIKVAAFWGHDAKAERQAYFDKFEEHKNWRNNIRFQLTNWTTFGIGATLCLVGTVLWLGEDSTRSWDRLWDLVGPFVIAVVGIYYVYQLMKRLDKAETEIRWLNLMLEQVKDILLGTGEADRQVGKKVKQFSDGSAGARLGARTFRLKVGRRAVSDR